MSNLPFELCKPIVDELDSRSDFIAFAPTSKAFWSEVISKLYDAVTLGDDITTTLFLSKYRANPTLVQLVRDLTVRTTWSQFFDISSNEWNASMAWIASNSYPSTTQN